MSVKQITVNDLRKMNRSEGLVFQGCGGDLSEWVNGINEMLTEAGILLNGTSFKEESCYSFSHDGVTCLLFPFDNRIKLYIGKLAMWRIQTHDSFGGMWLSDYISNRLDKDMDVSDNLVLK